MNRPFIRKDDVEAGRLSALQRYEILDTPEEAEFDDFTRLAAAICNAPVALISFVDEYRQWFKSKVGIQLQETPLDLSICKHALLQKGLFIVPDTTLDVRFKSNPLVTGEPHLRFYAGALLESSDAQPLGTLCVMDYQPRQLTKLQEDALSILARKVMTTMELRLSRRRLHSTIDSISDGFMTLDHELRFTYLNKSAEQLLGKEKHELIGKVMWEVGALGERGLFSSQLREAAGQKKTVAFEAFYEPTGRWLDVRCYPSVEGLTVYFHDFTLRRNKEQHLKLLETCVAQMNDIVIITEAAPLDEPGPRILYVNDAFVRVTGYAKEEAIGRSPRFLQGEQTQREVLDRIRSALANGEPVREEIINYTRSGKAIWLELNIVPVAAAEGMYSHTVAIERDITERKHAEESLRASEAAARHAAETRTATLNALPAHIALIDAEGKILAVNESWKRFALANSLRAQDFCVGDNYIEVCESASGEWSAEAGAVAKGIREVLAARTPEITIEYPCHSPTEHRWFRMMVTPLSEKERLGAVIMHFNITKRKLAEQRLQRLNRLYQMLSTTNEMIVTVNSREQLFEAGCRIAVEQGLFRMAAILILDPVTGEARPVAHFGVEEGYFKDISIVISDPALNKGTVGTALRTGQHNICNDFASDPRMASWKAAALKRGYLSTASFPIRTGGEVVGVLLLFASETDYFQDDEIKLLVAVAEDISFAIESINKEEQRLLAENALRTSEANMAAAQSISHFGSWELDLSDTQEVDANPLRWSDEMFRIAGFEPGAVEVTNELFFQLAHPDDREAIRVAVAEAIAARCEYSIVHRLIRPDGNERVVHEAAQFAFDQTDGRLVKMIGTAHDITEQRQAEESLRESDQRFRQLAENINEVFWITEPEKSEMLYISPGYERIWGRSCASLYQSPDTWLEAIHPDDRENVLAAAMAKQTAGTYDETYRIVRPDGELRWIHDRAYPVRDKQGVVYRMVGTAEDITDRKKAEETLHEQATLLDKAQDAILVRDLDHTIRYWNSSAERLYGWTAAEAVGRSAMKILYRDTTEFLAAAAIARSKGEWMGEMQQVTKDGRLIVVVGRWTLVRDKAGQPKSILSINTDITERKNLEQQFFRAQRMESIGTLAGGIAHDLNNVLAPIMMSIDLLRIYESNPRMLGILSTIESSAKRGAEMVKQVLTFARGVQGQEIEVQVGALIGEIVKIADETFLKNVFIRSIVPEDLWTVRGDPTQLHQVLLNLCVNARDAMPGGGSLIVSGSNILLDEQYAGTHLDAKPGPHVVIEVEDTGMGMPTDVIDRIFEPFFTTKEIGKGTGLGLSTSLSIVKSHGGFLRVFSERGVGTKFSVYLPANTSIHKEVTVKAPAALPRGNGELVLVIDDEPSVRDITRQTLEAFGYRVLLASDGVEATSIYAVRGHEIDIVLTDMMMPLLDGPTTVQVLKRLNPNVRIIAASGQSADGMETKAAAAGVLDFLTKPYTAEAMLIALRQVLR